jgi:hypothetical protein
MAVTILTTPPEEGDCNLYQNIGTASIYDAAYPEKSKLYIKHL